MGPIRRSGQGRPGTRLRRWHRPPLRHRRDPATRPHLPDRLCRSQLAVSAGGRRLIVTRRVAKDFAEGAESSRGLKAWKSAPTPTATRSPLSSCCRPPQRHRATERKVKGAKKVALDLLRKAIDEAGSVPPVSNHVPPNTRTISVETWRTYAYQGTITESDKPDTRQKAFVRAAKALQAANLIGTWGELVWII